MIDRNEIFTYVKKKYDTTPEYLWNSDPYSAVLKHPHNNKWYALIMNVPKEKLGMDGKEKIDLINIKCYPEMIGSLRKEKGILPAYHMNKEHWISIVLKDISPKSLFELLELSFEITK